jgi:tetratricopeptide (TPR) repeat protein
MEILDLYKLPKKVRRERSNQRLGRIIVLLIVFIAEAAATKLAVAQTINGSDPKYNSPIAAMNHLVLGLDLVKAGTADDLYYARQNFQFIINMKDDRGLRPVAYLNLGVVDTLEAKPESAIKNFNSAIELNPNYSEAFFNLGALHYKLGNLKKAEEAFLKAIEIDPGYGRAHYSLGFLYFEQKKYDLAKLHADKAAENGVPFSTLKERLAKVGR